MKTRIVLIIGLAVLASGLVSMFHIDDANACVPGSASYCNGAEEVIYKECRTPGGAGIARGALWFNKRGSSYFTDRVAVSHNEMSIDVSLRGSSYACGQSGLGTNEVFAVNIRPEGSNGWRLTGLSSTTLSRGKYQNSAWQWTTQGSSVNARLNLQGLIPENDSTSERAYNFTINLYRCYKEGWQPRPQGCMSTPVSIQIVRAGRPIQWNVTPTTTVSSGSSVNSPGQTLNWQHSVRNNGPDATNKWVGYSAQNQGYLGGATVASWGINSGLGVNRTTSSTSSRLITQADVGQNLCRRTTASPRTHSNNGTIASGQACRFIPYNYSLTPVITVPDSDQVVDADRITVPVRGTVTASGPTKSHPNIQWLFTQVEYPANLTTIPKKAGGNRTTSDGPCAFFTSDSSCRTVGSGTDASGIGHLASKTYTTTALREPRDVGTKICFSLSVRRNSSSSTEWRHSDLQCLIIGKKPKVQVHGSGVSVGRSFSGEDFNTGARIDTSITSLHGVPNGSGYESRTFGSWSEYGVFAPGEVRWMASASGLSEGSVSDKQVDWSRLSFTHANNQFGCSVEYGCYTPPRVNLPNVASIFPTTRAQSLGSAASINLSDLVDSSGGNHIATTNRPTLVITGGTLGAGRWVVLNAPDTHVIIAGDIQYSNDSLASISDIPQLVVIAQDITIASSVEHVDAWLIAQGALATCDQRGNATQLRNGSYYRSNSANLTADHCGRRLTVNGPVIANQLYLRRTAGSEAATSSHPLHPGQPAEVFNLRPDVYLWANNVGAKKVYKTTNIQELPPRY